MDKNTTIQKVYYDIGGLSSIRNTYKEAKLKDNTITYDDVKQWFEANIEKTGKYRGTNSYIAPHVYFQYQIDIAFFNDLNDPEFNQALVMIDIFSKFAVMKPIKNKQGPEVFEAFKDLIKQMNKEETPEIIYSDNEGAFNYKKMEEFYKNNDIDHIITLAHAPYVERFIRTIKDMIYKRVKQFKGRWIDYIYPSLVIYNYRMVHSSHGLTPSEARKDINHTTVFINLNQKRKLERKYPVINIGDTVKTFVKKDKLDKEYKPNWSENRYEVEDIINKHDQDFYKIKNRDKLYLRSELLKV